MTNFGPSKRVIDLTGQVFARLTVLHRTPPGGYGDPHAESNAFWLCQCECGRKTRVRSDSLKSGLTKSCGCLRQQRSSERIARFNHA